mmetsp:Transcript_11066/g.20116  ORF Transcript_11066/g.20116 Transcript_11066/m.20116 type:complete len:221 (+) Transcript_11066:129-791(+)
MSAGPTEGAPGQQDEVDGAGEYFVTALATVLTHLASARNGRPQRVTKFHSIRAPNLSVHDYLLRIAKFFQCSHECFVLCLIYIDRIVKLHPEFTMCHLNIHRLLVTSVMLAVKFFDDVYYSNAYYAKVGGVRTKEVNALEAQFLKLIEWRLHVTPQEYDQYRAHVYTAVRGTAPGPEEPLEIRTYQQPSLEAPWRQADAVPAHGAEQREQEGQETQMMNH